MEYSKIIVFLLMAFFLFSFVSADSINSEKFGYGRTKQLPVNFSMLPSVNNSLLWDGHAYDIFRWLDIDGGNANQNIDISPYNITAGAFIGDGSQLTGISIPTSNPFNQDLNTTDNVQFNQVNSSFVGDGSGLTNLPLQNFSYPHNQDLNTTDNVTFFNLSLNNLTAVGVKADIGNFTELYTSNGTLHIGNVSMSSNNDTLNIKSGQGVNASFFVGDGSKLTNLNLTNVSIDGGQVNATNFTGDNFFGGDFHGIYDWIAEAPWLNFNGTYLSFNESHFNNSVNNLINESNISLGNLTSLTLNGTTITDWSDINYTVSNDTIVYITPSVSGSYSVLLPEIISYQITQIIVTPTNLNKKYRFAMYELSGETIESDIMNHKGIWNIQKNYILNNQVTLNFTGVVSNNTFDVKIKYLRNINQ